MAYPSKNKIMKKNEIEYTYVVLQKYEDLEDGTPNFHYNDRIKISGKGSVLDFLNVLKRNSTNGLSIVEINFKFL